jgi:hypothetical protein
MNEHDALLLFPLYFVGLWWCATVVLGLISGWYRLMQQFPDREETPLLTLKNQSGSLGCVAMTHILNLSACPSGLRVGIMRVFAPFSRAFFVPWDAITIERKDWFFWRTANLSFGRPSSGRLRLPAELAGRLARAVPGRWPEPGQFPEQTPSDTRARLFKRWALLTAGASAFFLLAPRLMAPRAARVPVAIAILFPAIAYGIIAIVAYIRRPRP